jgi:hypothetical protein
MRRVAIAAALGALALPASAQGATYFNGDTAHGGTVTTAGRTIQHMEIYCSGGNDFSNRELAFSVADIINVGRHGRFSYSGKTFAYGPERQPRGEPHARISGRVGSRSVRINWSLPGCGSGSSTVTR